MCTHQRYVYNQYTQKHVLVRCGKCEACLQEKANARTRRIKNHQPDGCVPLFLTLTYSNDAIPYILHSDLASDDDEVPVWRNCKFRQLKNGMTKVTYSPSIIDSVDNPNKDKYNYFPHIRKARGCTGIIYYSDVQKFMKRLREVLKRKLNYEKYISYFAVGEYGPRTYRPHFHMLLYIDKNFVEAVRPYIIKSWPFGDMSRSNRRIQVARDAASYVSSYVNCSADLPKVLAQNHVRQKHAASKDFGAGLRCFSLPALLDAADRQDFRYHVQAFKDGCTVIVPLPIPAYIVNRFFPKFKGYSRCTNRQIFEFLRYPAKVRQFLQDTPFRYTDDDYRRFVVRLQNCFQKYQALTGKTEYDYCIDYVRCWQARAATILKHSYDGFSDFFDFYENIGFFLDPNSRGCNPGVVPTLPTHQLHRFQFDYNARKCIVQRDLSLIDTYRKKDKSKKINGLALSKLYDDF